MADMANMANQEEKLVRLKEVQARIQELEKANSNSTELVQLRAEKNKLTISLYGYIVI
jgi:hypothetical protein